MDKLTQLEKEQVTTAISFVAHEMGIEALKTEKAILKGIEEGKYDQNLEAEFEHYQRAENYYKELKNKVQKILEKI